MLAEFPGISYVAGVSLSTGLKYQEIWSTQQMMKYFFNMLKQKYSLM